MSVLGVLERETSNFNGVQIDSSQCCCCIHVCTCMCVTILREVRLNYLTMVCVCGDFGTRCEKLGICNWLRLIGALGQSVRLMFVYPNSSGKNLIITNYLRYFTIRLILPNTNISRTIYIIVSHYLENNLYSTIKRIFITRH